MEETKRNPLLRVLIIVSFVLMVAANAIATLVKINGQTTAEVSDAYGNLFAPAGITFSIWSVIYTLLLAYAIYQLIFFAKNRDADSHRTMVRIGVLFILSSIINTAWIICWHYELFIITVALIFALLLCLILISMSLRKKKLSLAEKILVRLPFSIYFGWITVASIANVTTFLVSIEWPGLGLSEMLWTVIMLVAGTLIAAGTVLFAKDLFYGLTVVWAYAGIVIKHLDPEGFDGEYLPIIIVACVCIAILLLESIVIGIFGKLPSSGKKAVPEETETPAEPTVAEENPDPQD
ncbi:MAG: tryptophan-rich sensory protein [Clostridiaceae bacterium]|nr:tryptophan-rich sensory protein [Oscillospiraceae bacterium]NLO63217.1 tryptophan-rich sensory protein [Clostridiaceae bacterium]